MLWYSTKFNGCPVNVLFQPMAGHKFQAMDCLMFQNQKVTHSVSDSVTRSPIELLWTAKKYFITSLAIVRNKLEIKHFFGVLQQAIENHNRVKESLTGTSCLIQSKYMRCTFLAGIT